MTTYPEAVDAILRHVPVLQAEEKPVLRCIGQVTAAEIFSGLDLPQLPTSMPDGYAVRAADVAGAGRENPVTLKVIATARAGVPARKTVTAGSAIRVMTGAALPKGADCVIRFEDTDEPTDKNGPNAACPSVVRIFAESAAGANVIKAGGMVKRGALVIPKGTGIGPAQISALISIGKTRIRVVRRPVIAVIATGDELVSSGRRLVRGMSYNSNSAALSALIAHHGGIPKILGIARDSQAALKKKISQALSADAIISSGGVSKGDFDLVRLVLGQMGTVVFARLHMGPGAAVTFGRLTRKEGRGKAVPVPLFALSGPPSGCLINFETLVRPAIRQMLGYTVIRHPDVEAEAVDSFAARAPFPFVKWMRLEETEGGYKAQFSPYEGAGLLAGMASANSIAILPKGAQVVPGDKIRILPLDRCL